MIIKRCFFMILRNKNVCGCSTKHQQHTFLWRNNQSIPLSILNNMSYCLNSLLNAISYSHFVKFSLIHILSSSLLYLKHTNLANTTIAESANTVHPDETAHDELFHLDLQCLPSSLRHLIIINTFYTESISKF